MTTHRITVITAVAIAHLPLVRDAGESLAAQRLPPGWSYEWLVQVDGAADLGAGRVARSLQDAFTADVMFNGGHAGPAATRNLALARATGAIVVTLDADDLLPAEALASVTRHFAMNPDVGWIAGGSATVSSSGAMIEDYDPPILAGRRVGQRELTDFWLQMGHNPVIPRTAAYRVECLSRVGGWMGLPRSEDTGTLLAVNESAPGLVIADCVSLKRRSTNQITATSWTCDHSDVKGLGRRLISRRIAAMRGEPELDLPDRRPSNLRDRRDQ